MRFLCLSESNVFFPALMGDSPGCIGRGRGYKSDDGRVVGRLVGWTHNGSFDCVFGYTRPHDRDVQGGELESGMQDICAVTAG